MPSITIAELNALDRHALVERLGGVFEHSPWVAEQVCAARPFVDRRALHAAMLEAVGKSGRERQLALIRAHPDLAGKAAAAGTLTAASRVEQASAGLDRCTPAELAEINDLNRAYRERFGFPFIMAVKGRGKAEILQAFRRRLDNDVEHEFEQALAQIARITELRLLDLIEP